MLSTLYTDKGMMFEPAQMAERCIIILHDFGSDGYDVVSVVDQLDKNLSGNIRYCIPHAPLCDISIYQDLTLRAWYNLYYRDLRGKIDLPGLLASTERICGMIEHQVMCGISAKSIVLIGLSQGAALSLELAMKHTYDLAGIASFAGYIPTMPTNASAYRRRKKLAPILMMHGLLDDVVPIDLGLQSYRWLADGGAAIIWKAYKSGHGVCNAQMYDLIDWIELVLGRDAN